VTGDVRIQCRVVSVDNTNVWAKAGVMLRDGLAANARNVLVAFTPRRRIAHQSRAPTGGSPQGPGPRRDNIGPPREEAARSLQPPA